MSDCQGCADAARIILRQRETINALTRDLAASTAREGVTREEVEAIVGAALEQARETLERNTAAKWDHHYGNGLSVEYARSVDQENHGAIARIDDALAVLRTPRRGRAQG
jgi:hypothetical protein